MADRTMKRGDLLPPVIATLTVQDDLGEVRPVNLTDATSVWFIMAPEGGAQQATVRGQASVYTDATANPPVTAASGKVIYHWAPGDTEVPGSYEAEWEVIWPDPVIAQGRPRTYPQETFHTFDILQDRGGR